MPKVRLSGTVLGENDPTRSTRARLLHLLFSHGWDIYNGNGDQRITLSNIERKIIESDAFVFTPGATLEDMFKAISIFVGYQTLDCNLAGKPTVVLNSDFSWDPFFSVLGHLHKMGTIQQDYRDYLLAAETCDEVIKTLDVVRHHGIPDAGRVKIGESNVGSFETPLPANHAGNICVFCSASLTDPAFLADGEELGRRLAQARLGCVSGAGKSGIMGAVVKGAVEAGGWTAGSNVPHIIELEGLPEGLSSFWLRPDIYTRMEVMIQNSDGFVIFPGGAGTVQELFALMIFKRQQNPLMMNKPVVLFNRPNAAGIGFWDPLIDLLDGMCQPGDFVVARSLDDVVPVFEPKLRMSA
ncbi:MAG: LOG family protein [Luteolibacter sp.]